MISGRNIARSGSSAKSWPGVPRIALTATADPHTRDDIAERLGLNGARVFSRASTVPTSPTRSSSVTSRASSSCASCRASRMRAASSTACPAPRWRTPRVAGDAGHSRAALPCRSRPRGARCPSGCVPEGGEPLPRRDRRLRHGHRQADVRYVAHLDLPGSVEAYYQETGRARA